MTDKELLDMLIHDPVRGLEHTVRQYTPYVMKIARVKLSGFCQSEDIEELVSDVFMQLYRTVARYGDNTRSVKALLAVIARRKCADACERLQRQKERISLDELPEDIAAEPEQDIPDRERLIAALHALGQPDEQIFIRKYFFGQKSGDIAADLGMKTNTVDKRISRGLKKLKEIMEEDK